MYRIAAGVISCLLCCQVVICQTPDSIRSALDAGDYLSAKAQAEELIANSSGETKAEAAALLLRSYNFMGDNASLVESFDNCAQIAAGTVHEAQCYLERAKSTYVNAKLPHEAVTQYNSIIENFPADAAAVQESLFRRGEVELNGMANAEQAKNTFAHIAASHSASPYADDAFAALAKCEAQLLNPDGIALIAREFNTKFPGSPLKPQVLLVQGDFANKTSGDRLTALRAYTELISEFPNGVGAAIARIRVADMANKGTFEKSILEYESILKEFPGLPKSLVDWCNCQIGLFQWQLDRPELAKPFLQKVIEANPTDKNVLQNARITLQGIENHDSIEGLIALYDRALRWRKVNVCIDLAWRDLFKVKRLAEQPFYAAYCNDTSFSSEERAQMRYRLALVEFMVGDHAKMDEHLEKVYALSPKGITRHMAMYMEAYHHGHCGKGEHAQEIFQQIINERPGHEYLVPKTYVSLVGHYEKNGDDLGAILLAEEFKILYPYRKEHKHFQAVQDRIAVRDPELKATFEREKIALLDKLRTKYKTPILISAPPEEASKQNKELSYYGEGN